VAEITRIRRRRGVAVTFAVELDEMPWVVVDEAALVRLGWHVGLDLDDDARRHGEHAARLGATERRAARLLAARPHARRELELKLARTGGGGPAREITRRLVDHGLLDDDAYARRVAARRLAQGYGPARIEADLERAGVATPLARQVVQSLERDAVLDAARRAAGPAPDEGAWRRLVGRGFDADLVEDVLGAP
jgi:regulatory protein